MIIQKIVNSGRYVMVIAAIFNHDDDNDDDEKINAIKISNVQVMCK